MSKRIGLLFSLSGILFWFCAILSGHCGCAFVGAVLVFSGCFILMDEGRHYD